MADHSHCAKVYADSYNALYSAQRRHSLHSQRPDGTCMHCPAAGPLLVVVSVSVSFD
jgi:hypothetical protein